VNERIKYLKEKKLKPHLLQQTAAFNRELPFYEAIELSSCWEDHCCYFFHHEEFRKAPIFDVETPWCRREACS